MAAWTLMPARGLPEASQRVTVISLSKTVLPWPRRRMPSRPVSRTVTLSTFTRLARGATMPFRSAPLPSSVPPATETWVAPEATCTRKVAATEGEAARIVAPPAIRQVRLPSTSPAPSTS